MFRLSNLMAIWIYVSYASVVIEAANKCIPRNFGESSIVCVCSATYCDTAPDVSPDPGSFVWYVSSKRGERMNMAISKIGNEKRASTIITLNPEKTYQSIIGFGGAFTDSAGINIKKLSNATQKQLLMSYFSQDGSRYNFGRIPIGATDFSTRFYTYDEIDNDNNLNYFSLAPEDTQYKIPLMQEALEINSDLRFVSAAWTSPTWMKTNDESSGFGFLKKEYYQLYADYLLRFLDEYKKFGLEMWAITTGNEPSNAFIPNDRIVNLGWSSETVSTWIANNLGPSLARSKHNKTLILALDDQRFYLPWYIELMFKNNITEKYVSGIAVHWYWDILIPTSLLDSAHEKFPDKFLLMTEVCEGSYPWQIKKVRLGSWGRAEDYVLRMFENFNHWFSGWIDWNLVLDKEGGPNYINNFVDAAIIVNPETDEFFKQPVYYIIQHFSRFLPRGSVRIDCSDNTILFHPLTSMAFITPENRTVILVYNSRGNSKEVDIVDPRGAIINLELPGSSMSTIIY